jgi:O-antigen/teichoic acid export membrane protein
LLNFFKSGAGYFNSVKWGSYAVVISFLRQICLVPVFIFTVGSYGYSFWLILSTIVTLVTALSLGHLHYSSNLINISYHKKGDVDNEFLKIQGANYIYIVLQLLLGVILSFTPVLSLVSSFPVNYLEANHAGYAFLFLLIGKIIYQYCGLFVLRLFEPIGRINTTLKYQAIGDMVDFLAILTMIFATHSIFYTCIAVFISNVSFSVIMMVYVSRKAPFKLTLKKSNFADSHRFIKTSFSLNASFLIEKVYETGLNLIIVRVFSPAILPVFTTSRILTNIFYRICTVMVVPLFPDIQKEFALNNYSYIIDKMKVFWTVLSLFIIICISIGLPLLPYIYSIWTSNKLSFNIQLICLLFMAVSFQNFGMIISEFFKRTNFSRQILIFNTIKSVITIAAIVAFGNAAYLPGLGVALLLGELLCVIYSMGVLRGIFKNNVTLNVLLSYMLPIVLFCASLLFYIWILNYWLFLFCDLIIIIICMYKNDNFVKLKSYFNL